MKKSTRHISDEIDLISTVVTVQKRDHDGYSHLSYVSTYDMRKDVEFALFKKMNARQQIW